MEFSLNPDCREQLDLWPSIKLGTFFFSSELNEIFLKLSIPCLPSYASSSRLFLPVLTQGCRQVEEWLSAGNIASQSCFLAGVPAEIFHFILGEISADIHDLAALALTCKIVLVAAKPYILEALKTIHAPWAGRRIICLGDYTNDDDLPAGFMTEEESREARTASLPGYDDDISEGYYAFATETYRGVSEYRDRRSSDSRWDATVVAMYAGTCTAVDKQDYDRFISLCGYGGRKEMYPPGEPVLFNLSKGEYIRLSPLVELKITDVSISLINGLLARICWSGSPGDHSMWLDKALEEELGRGRWAGDRFCITTMDDMPHAPDGREWVDMSEETAEFLFHLWRHERRRDPLCDEE